MPDFFYTIVRNLPGDQNEKPNGFLFASQEKPSDETMRRIYYDPDLRAMLPKDKPVFCVRYYKLPNTAPGFLPEWRITLTSLSYYALPLNDERDNVSVLWEETGGLIRRQERLLHYKDLLAECTELFRVDGCKDCPKKGLQCIERNFGHRPWFMLFSFNRKSDWDAGLAEQGNILDRKTRNEEHEFQGKNLEEIVRRCERIQPAGAQFRSPSQTKPQSSPKMNHPLRPSRDHRFFKDPDYVEEKKPA
jgi:hypothetical protein